jgi:uncharacterized protein YdhG (YjbR/CyaY superfamily)
MTVDTYLAALPDPSRLVLQRVRMAIREAVPELAETISYGIPTFTLDGKALLHLGAWKAHWSLYPATPKLLKAVPALAPYKASKGTLKFAYDAPIALAAIKAAATFLRAARSPASKPRVTTKAKTKPKPRAVRR